MSDNLITEQFIVMERSVTGQESTYRVEDLKTGLHSDNLTREKAHEYAALLNG